jgi:hypothetical protein
MPTLLPVWMAEYICATLASRIGREHVDDPVDGFCGAGRVQRTEHQVAGFGGGHGQADGFQVAHFADQNRVRVFTQCGLERGGK